MKNIIEVCEPTAHIAINKSRVKMYDKNNEIPVYYLNKSSEFQIELFNPTQGTILAKIYLNNKPISNGGLILRAGERVFLDRFLDVNKKFLFDTYEVSNSSEVKKAIKNNGDIKVGFYKEEIIKTNYALNNITTNWYDYYPYVGDIYHNTCTDINTGTNTNIPTFYNTTNTFSGEIKPQATLDCMSNLYSDKLSNVVRSHKKIETGIVEKGSESNQQIKMVDKTFESYSFHQIKYKLLPISQKNVNIKEVRKLYCTECGAKNKPTNKFCPKCGKKQ